MTLTSKQRAYLKSLAMNIDPVVTVGKASLSPEVTASADEALEARELIKISVLKSVGEDPGVIAEMISSRTHSIIVQIIGRKIVLYREGIKDKKKIILP